MLFFGWGKSNKQWVLPDGRVIVAVWSYFHIFWLFCFSWGVEWHLLADKRSEDEKITIDQARNLSRNPKLNIPFIDRFGWLVVIIFFVLLNIFFG